MMKNNDLPTKVIPCPNPDCTQQLRIPDLGRQLRIGCPKCGHKFLLAPDTSARRPDLAPDYGMHLHSSGVSPSRAIDLLNVQIPVIQCLENGRYRAHTSGIVEGKEYAMTIEFDGEVLRSIREVTPPEIQDLIDSVLDTGCSRRSRPILVEFPSKITVPGFRVHLATIEHAQFEDFVPFIADELLTDTIQSQQSQTASVTTQQTRLSVTDSVIDTLLLFTLTETDQSKVADALNHFIDGHGDILAKKPDLVVTRDGFVVSIVVRALPEVALNLQSEFCELLRERGVKWETE